jgi:hypothetical protein
VRAAAMCMLQRSAMLFSVGAPLFLLSVPPACFRSCQGGHLSSCKAGQLDRARHTSACTLTPLLSACLQNYPLYVMLGIAGGLATYMPMRHLMSDPELS